MLCRKQEEERSKPNKGRKEEGNDEGRKEGIKGKEGRKLKMRRGRKKIKIENVNDKEGKKDRTREQDSGYVLLLHLQ